MGKQDDKKKGSDLPPPDADEVFEMEIDIDTFTLGEVDEFEEATGLSFQSIGQVLNDPTAKVGKLLRGLALISLKRDKPDTTWEDTARLNIPRPVSGEETDPLD